MRILIAEDNEYITDMLVHEVVEAFQAEVVTVDTGNKAIRILKEDKKFNFIICDYSMPDGMGSDVLNFIVDNEIEIPFAYFTSRIDELLTRPSKIFVGSFAKSDFAGLSKVIKGMTSD